MIRIHAMPLEEVETKFGIFIPYVTKVKEVRALIMNRDFCVPSNGGDVRGKSGDFLIIDEFNHYKVMNPVDFNEAYCQALNQPKIKIEKTLTKASDEPVEADCQPEVIKDQPEHLVPHEKQVEMAKGSSKKWLGKKK